MFLRTDMLAEKKLVGLSQTMSLTQNKTYELWRSFMPRRNEIKNRTTSDLISMQVYDSNYNFKNFDFGASFTKWAVAQVNSFENVPEGMKTFILPEGLYAVFLHQGATSDAEKTFRYIFETWFPNSQYSVAFRPHFEILGAKYIHGDASSEEEVWVPIK